MRASYNNMNYSHFIKIIYLNPETEGQSAGTRARTYYTPTLYNTIFYKWLLFFIYFSPIYRIALAPAV